MPIVDIGVLRHELAGKCGFGRRATRLAPTDCAELAGVRVLENVGIDRGTDREIAQLGYACVDELMRRIGSPAGAANEVSPAHGVLVAAVAQCTLALQNEEHFLVGVVIVEWKRPFSRRYGCDVVAQLARPQPRGHRRELRLELVAVPSVASEFQLVAMEDGPGHRSTSPKTISCVPMIATTSAIMCPRDISSSAARYGKLGARSFR